MLSTHNGDGPRAGRLYVVVGCTHRKTRTVPAELRLGDATGTNGVDPCREWTGRLAHHDVPALVASRLYAGEHWTVARQFLTPMLGAGSTQLWVCSAGYGLIPATAPIKPYSATFAAGHDDSVPGGFDGARDWWQALSSWQGPVADAPRSLRELARSDPSASWLVVLSPPYLLACHNDILAAADILTDPDRLLIVSAGMPHNGSLAGFLVPADARLQYAVGGTRQALNVRVAAHLVKQGACYRAAATEELGRLLAAHPAPPRHDRQRLTDRQVLDFIANQLEHDPNASASRLLRRLRDGGLACEQKRFAVLYRTLTEATR